MEQGSVPGLRHVQSQGQGAEARDDVRPRSVVAAEAQRGGAGWHGKVQRRGAFALSSSTSQPATMYSLNSTCNMTAVVEALPPGAWYFWCCQSVPFPDKRQPPTTSTASTCNGRLAAACKSSDCVDSSGSSGGTRVHVRSERREEKGRDAPPCICSLLYCCRCLRVRYVRVRPLAILQAVLCTAELRTVQRLNLNHPRSCSLLLEEYRLCCRPFGLFGPFGLSGGQQNGDRPRRKAPLIVKLQRCFLQPAHLQRSRECSPVSKRVETTATGLYNTTL